MNIFKKIVLIFAIFYSGYIMFAVVYYLGTNISSAQNPSSPVCLTGFKNISFHDKCSNRQSNTYRRANFRCYDGSRGEFRSRYCLDEAVFSKAAYAGCNTIAKCPIISVSPTPTCVARPPCLDTPPYCAMPEPIGGWCPGPTPTTIVVGDCVWCGSDCVDGPLYPGRPCNLGLPPSGAVCKRVAGVCQAIGPTISTVICPSPARCGPGGNLIIGDPKPDSGPICPQYFCQYPSPIPN